MPRRSLLATLQERPLARLILALLVALLAFASVPTSASKDQTGPPHVRWSPRAPGCTFTATDDGKYRYGLSSGNYDVSVAVDAQELEKVHRRIEPFFSLLLTLRYRGSAALTLEPGKASLEFVRHYKVVQMAIDPEHLAQRTQDDADQLEYTTEREIEKHPERKEERERYVQAYQKEVATFLDFLSRNTLGMTQLDHANPETSGWILFSTQSKWIGSWKTPEELVFSLPLPDQVLEFPIKLPPEPGDLILRRRAE